MSSHATAELLSAYLDHELPEEEVEVLESHLDHCHDCHRRLKEMSTVVGNLRHLERMAPPPTLDLTVARRIALAGENKTLLDRFEGGLESFQRKSSMMMWFCMVIALVMIVFFFLNTLASKQNGNIPVIFHDNPPAVVTQAPGEDGNRESVPTARIFQQQGDDHKEIGELGSRIDVGGIVFERGADDTWHDVRITSEMDDQVSVYFRDSEDYRQLLAAHPEISALDVLEGTTFVLVEDRVVGLRGAAKTKAATPSP